MHTELYSHTFRLHLNQHDFMYVQYTPVNNLHMEDVCINILTYSLKGNFRLPKKFCIRTQNIFWVAMVILHILEIFLLLLSKKWGVFSCVFAG